jgi:hypothetical protein
VVDVAVRRALGRSIGLVTGRASMAEVTGWLEVLDRFDDKGPLPRTPFVNNIYRLFSYPAVSLPSANSLQGLQFVALLFVARMAPHQHIPAPTQLEQDVPMLGEGGESP